MYAPPNINLWQLTQENGRLFISVPWGQADYYQALLQTRGFDSTMCLNPQTREAWLELWTNLSLVRVRELLGAALGPPR
jgi:hypothetical protein